VSLAKLLAEKTAENPIFLHIDSIGLLNFGEHIGKTINEILENKLKKLSFTLNETEKLGGNILVPAFSYSTTSGELFDLENTPSDVGAGMEFLRKENRDKRSADPIFSYTVFSKNEVLRDREVRDYETFGENDIISKVFEMDGYIGGIGGVLKRMTEAHFLERKLKVPYRFDKDFFGEVRKYGEIQKVKHRYFCRDFSYKKATDFAPLLENARRKGIVEVWEKDGIQIEAVKMRNLFELMKEKIEIDTFYFCRDED
jgi:aminoglycoside 3-N-acetyltransferase